MKERPMRFLASALGPAALALAVLGVPALAEMPATPVPAAGSAAQPARSFGPLVTPAELAAADARVLDIRGEA